MVTIVDTFVKIRSGQFMNRRTDKNKFGYREIAVNSSNSNLMSQTLKVSFSFGDQWVISKDPLFLMDFKI